MQWFHEVIADRLEDGYERMLAGENVRQMYFMPPRHGKSEECTQKFPAWVLGKNPVIPVMVSSYSQDLATDFGQNTRDIMQSDEYSVMFNTRLRADAKAKGRWLTQEKGGYTAVGVGGALTGRGFKIGIIDDPFKNREEADSPVIRESRYKWFQSTFFTRQEGASMIVFILTRWHEDDLAGRVLKDSQEAKKNGEPYDEWEVIEFKALATFDSNYRKEGEALWPAKFSVEQLKKIKTQVGPFEFSALYQQHPIDDENRKFKEEWFKYRRYEDVSAWETYNTMTIDPRGKDDVKLGKDYIGITINLIDKDNNWNIMSDRRKLSANDLIDWIFTSWKKYHLDVIGIEDTQFTQGLLSQIEMESRRRNIYPYIVLLKTRGTQKELRIESSLVPRYSAGTIYHLTYGDQNMCTDLEDELALFPKATNDDASDSLAYQDQVAMKPDEENDGEATSGNVTSMFTKRRTW